MPKIIFLDTDTLGQVSNLKLFESLGDCMYYQTTSPEETSERIAEAEIVLTNKVVLDRKVLERARQLKYIGILATGTNNVDLVAAEELGIKVQNVAGYSTQSVAQHTFALLFHLLHHTAYFESYVSRGDYAQSPTFTHLGRSYWELSGKTWGIIGLGAIGRAVGSLAKAFGCEVIYFSTSGKNDQQDFRRVSWEYLLAESDVLSIHAPLNERTKNLVGPSALAHLKSTAYLINVGRGGIVDEKALVNCLDQEDLAGAALDVLEKEPISRDHPYFAMKRKERLLITPHIAWASSEAREELLRLAVNHLKTYLHAS